MAFAHDTELRLVAVTDPQGLTWRYEYDPEGTPRDGGGLRRLFRRDRSGG